MAEETTTTTDDGGHLCAICSKLPSRRWSSADDAAVALAVAIRLPCTHYARPDVRRLVLASGRSANYAVIRLALSLLCVCAAPR